MFTICPTFDHKDPDFFYNNDKILTPTNGKLCSRKSDGDA